MILLPPFLPRVKIRMGDAAADQAAAAAAAATADQAVKAAQEAAATAAASAQGAQRGIQMPESASDLLIHGARVKLKVLPPPGSSGTAQEIVAMIDTGASISGVIPSTAQAAGLVQTSSVQIGGVVGTQERPIYAAQLDLPEYNIHFDAIEIAGVDLPQQDIQALIGRDMLQKMNLLYSGPDAKFALMAPGPASLLSTIVAGGVAALAFGSLFFIAGGSK